MIDSQKIIVALDTCDSQKLDDLFIALKGEKIWVKIGMELFYSLGPEVIFKAKNQGFKVFLDLKLHDIPHTVFHAMKALTKLPIDMINVHAAGGKVMMQKSVEALSSFTHRPLIIAVTQLTSTTQEEMNLYQGISGKIEDAVLHYAKLAQQCQLDGVVCSPLEVRMIKEQINNHFLTITPGIRPRGSDLDDQKRITTPDEAIALGSDFLVIGRPITASADPKKSLLSILKGPHL